MLIAYLVSAYHCDGANLDRMLEMAEFDYTAVAYILLYIVVMVTRWKHVVQAESVIESDRCAVFQLQSCRSRVQATKSASRVLLRAGCLG